MHEASERGYGCSSEGGWRERADGGGHCENCEQCSWSQMEATMQNEHAAWYMPMHMHATRKVSTCGCAPNTTQ